MKDKVPWYGWMLGVETDTEYLTMKEVLETLPAAEESDIPEIIRKYENPESSDALPGAISLKRHDCVHVLLGRGLHVQDESFVIGFTMGAASDITDEHLDTFRRVSVEEYPKPYNFTESDIISFDIGVAAAKDMCPNSDIHLFPLENEENMNRTVYDLRRQFNILPSELRAYYAHEQLMRPDTKASRRLDLDDADDSQLIKEGIDSDWVYEK